MAPSLVTIAALCAGMSALRMDLEGHLETALTLLLLAMVLDAVDGKLARWLDTASPFGAELDSLSDFFNFGIVPGILIYNNLYAGTDYANLGWIACLAIAICCALRLARFNLARKSGASDDVFLGVPAPALACLALMPVFMHLCDWDTPAHPLLRTAYIIGVGLLAISTIPTISIKHVSLRASLSLPVAALGGLIVYGLITSPWPTLVALNCLYLGLLPLYYMKLSRAPKTLADDLAPSAD
jgi:CDP-diacylglycerol--serine O-phosphatidyltransferase